jgi:hypothetical protein
MEGAVMKSAEWISRLGASIVLRIIELLRKPGSRWLDYIIVLTFAVLPIWRTGVRGVFNKTDLDFPLNPVDHLIRSLYVWDHGTFTGWDTTASSIPLVLDRSLFLGLLAYIGLDVGIIQRVYFVGILVGMSLGMYYLFTHLFADFEERSLRIGGLLASLFYIFNPQVVLRLYYGNGPWLEGMAALPFTFILIHQGLDKTVEGLRASFKYAVVAALTTTVLLSTSYPLAILMSILLGSYFLVRLIADLVSGRIINVVRKTEFALITVLIAFLLNSWWLFPTVYSSFFGEVSRVMESLRAGSEMTGGFNDIIGNLRRQT